MSNAKVYQKSFSKVYPLLVNKAIKKGRSKEEVDELGISTTSLSGKIWIWEGNK